MVNNKPYPFFEGWDFPSWKDALCTLALLIVGCVLAIAFLIIVPYKASQQVYAYEETVTYYVEQGDTLWTIARQYATEKQDIREVILIFFYKNYSTPTFYPGEAFAIPLFNFRVGRKPPPLQKN